MKQKIYILGAGITGLFTALKLSEKGYDVEVIEKDNEVGGMARTIRFHNTDLDLGPHKIFTLDQNVINLVKKDWLMYPKKGICGSEIN